MKRGRRQTARLTTDMARKLGTDGARCQHCGRVIKTKKRGGRKWCNERCRNRAQQKGRCECGAPMGGRKARKCRACYDRDILQQAVENYIQAIHDWAELYGRPPTSLDWQMTPTSRRVLSASRWAMLEEAHAARDWPSASLAWGLFGSWREALRAAGYEPRKPGGQRDATRR